METESIMEIRAGELAQACYRSRRSLPVYWVVEVADYVKYRVIVEQVLQEPVWTQRDRLVSELVPA